MDNSKFQRALGYLEGMAMAMKDPVKSLLMQTVEDIEAAVVPEKQHKRAGTGNPDVNGLIKRLVEHHQRQEQGKTQDYSKVCLDCKRAAEMILQLQYKLEQMQFEEYGRG